MEAWPLENVFMVGLALIICATAVFFFRANSTDRQRQTRDNPSADPTQAPAAGRLERHPGGECPICLSSTVVTPVQTNCGHWFCAKCILAYYDRLGRVRIKCPICRQEVTMLHRAADDDPDQAPPPADSADVQEQIARFNERNSWTRRTPWQMIVDAPLLLRRLLSDLRRGDIQVFRELIRRGFQLKILVGALYVLSPVDVVPEGRVGMIIGLLDDVLVILFFLFHITTVYRAILLSWDRARVARAASGTGTDTDEAGPIEPRDTDGVINPRDGFRGHAVVEGPGTAVFFAIFAGAMASFAGAGDGASGLAAVAAGVVAAVVTSANVNANAIPPLARDW